ncbi:MAG: PEP-CTERM sorting domain-containing protein [Opitutales bacterium]
MKQLATALLTLGACASFVQAQVVSFDFTTFDVDASDEVLTTGFFTDTIPSNGAVPVGTIDANLLQTTAFTHVGGSVSPAAPGDGYRVDFVSTGGPDDASYYSFTIQADTGFQLNLAGAEVSYEMGRPGGAGAPDWAISTSVEGLGVANALESQTGWGPGDNTPGSFIMPNDPLTYDGLTGPVEFRIYAGGGNGIFDINSFNVGGSVSAIPEPSTYALIIGVFVVGLAGLRRRSRAK